MRTIYVVDDDDAVRASVQTLLSTRPNLLVRVFKTGDAFLAESADLDAGVLLLDYHMPGATGLDVLRAIAGHQPPFVAIVLTGQGDVQVAVQAMKAGAVEFLEKPYSPRTLLEIVENCFLRLEKDAAAAAQVNAAKTRIARLSARETEVLMGLIDGKLNKVIAHELQLSPRTVEIYRANLMDKLAVRSLSEALRLAFVAGLIKSD